MSTATGVCGLVSVHTIIIIMRRSCMIDAGSVDDEMMRLIVNIRQFKLTRSR